MKRVMEFKLGHDKRGRNAHIAHLTPRRLKEVRSAPAPAVEYHKAYAFASAAFC